MILIKHWRVFDNTSKPEQPPPFEIIPNYRPRLQGQDRHEYYIEFRLKNNSGHQISDFRVDIEFPINLINLSTSNWLEVRDKRNDKVMLLRKINPDPHTGQQTVLYDGDEIMLLSMEYFVTTELFRAGALLQDIKATVYSGDMKPTIVKIPMKNVTNF